MNTPTNNNKRITLNIEEMFSKSEYTFSQGESPSVFYVNCNNTRIARVTGRQNKGFTIKMTCGITLTNKYTTTIGAAEAAFKFYKDNFYLDFINA
jgi:hypothetical protein